MMSGNSMEASRVLPAEPRLERIAIDQIDPRERSWTVREWVEESDLELLATSIRESGELDVPLTVRTAREADGYAYELILGKRRMIGAQRAKVSHVLAFICNVDDEEALAAAIRADTASRQLSTLERGWALIRLRTEWDSEVHGEYQQQRLAERVGAKPSTVSEAIRTAEDIPRSLVKDAAEANCIPTAHLAGLQRRAVRKVREVPDGDRARILNLLAAEISRCTENGSENDLLADKVTAIAIKALRKVDNKPVGYPPDAIAVEGSRIRLDVGKPVAQWSEDERQRAIELLGPVIDEVRRIERFSVYRKAWATSSSRARPVLRHVISMGTRWWYSFAVRFPVGFFAGRTQGRASSTDERR